MIVGYLDLESVAIDESETDAPLVVDANRMLPFSLTLEGVQSIARRRLQIIEPSGEMDIFQATNGPSDQIRRQAS
jgi:hypothetical protein